MPCVFHVLRSTAHSLRVDDHGSRAVDIMCKRHDRTHTLALSQSNTQTRCKDYCNAMTTAHTRNGWPSIQTACVCLQFRNGSHAACRPWECTTAKVFCSMFYVSHAECVPIRKRHDHGHGRCVSSVPMCKRWSVYTYASPMTGTAQFVQTHGHWRYCTPSERVRSCKWNDTPNTQRKSHRRRVCADCNAMPSVLLSFVFSTDDTRNASRLSVCP